MIAGIATAVTSDVLRFLTGLSESSDEDEEEDEELDEEEELEGAISFAFLTVSLASSSVSASDPESESESELEEDEDEELEEAAFFVTDLVADLAFFFVVDLAASESESELEEEDDARVELVLPRCAGAILGGIDTAVVTGFADLTSAIFFTEDFAGAASDEAEDELLESESESESEEELSEDGSELEGSEDESLEDESSDESAAFCRVLATCKAFHSLTTLSRDGTDASRSSLRTSESRSAFFNELATCWCDWLLRKEYIIKYVAARFGSMAMVK